MRHGCLEPEIRRVPHAEIRVGLLGLNRILKNFSVSNFFNVATGKLQIK